MEEGSLLLNQDKISFLWNYIKLCTKIEKDPATWATSVYNTEQPSTQSHRTTLENG